MTLASIAVSVVAGASLARDGVGSSRVIALLALAGAAIALSLSPEFLFLGWLFFAPLFQEAADETSLGHVLTLALYVAPPLVFLLWTLTRRTPVHLGLIDLFPAAYVLYVLGSLALTTSLLFDDPFGAGKAFYTTIGIGVILYYFLSFGPVGSLTTPKVIAVLFASALVEAAMAFADSFAGWNLWPTRAEGGVHRAVATLTNPGVLGGFLSMSVVLAVSVLVWRGPKMLRKLAIATLVLGAPALLLTYTRGAIISAVVAATIVAASRSETRIVAAGLILVSTIFLIISWGRITSTEVYQERVADPTNVEGRLLLSDWSVKLAAERPLFGWGYESFDRVKDAANFNLDPGRVSAGTTSHNTYLTVLVNHGGVGLVLLLAPWLVIGGRSFRMARARPELRWFLVGAVAAIGAFVINANTLDMRFFSFVPMLPWLLLGLMRRHLQATPSDRDDL